ncbi:amino acid adenylation domain-containing protein [Nonomuraea sp. NPDC002799]
MDKGPSEPGAQQAVLPATVGLLPATPVHELVRERAVLQPNAPAIDGLSYQELNTWADRIACNLQDQGIDSGGPIAMRLPIGARQVATLLAIMKVGCYFVPLSLGDPAERCIYILNEIKPTCLLVEQLDEDALITWCRSELGCPVLAVGTENDPQPQMDVPSTRTFTSTAVGMDTPVYVVYTSGSTGRPKGIQQSHIGLAQFVMWMGTEFGMGPGRRIAQWAAPNYDASFCEIFATLVTGGMLCPIPDEIRLDASLLLDWLALRRICLLQTVPSFACELLHSLNARTCAANLASLDHILLAGEPLYGELASGLAAAIPGLRLINLYGATETILATWMEVTGEWNGPVPVGKAIPGRSVSVLDVDDNLCPVGVTGEIVVRSQFLTRGYVGEASQSGSKFRSVRMAGDSAGIAASPCYRTGDQGRWRPDGLLEFQGRLDGQVKLRGVRVELAEIEVALRSHRSVLDCAVVPSNSDGELMDRLVAYVVPVSGRGSPMIWRAHLRSKLAEHMLPSVFITLSALPRNAGGKVDRSRLSSSESPPWRGARPHSSGRLNDFLSWSASLELDPDQSSIVTEDTEGKAHQQTESDLS